MAEKLIPATQLAEYVYCSHAWYLKQHGVQVSQETRVIQAEANACHEQQGRSLAVRGAISRFSARWSADPGTRCYDVFGNRPGERASTRVA